MSDVSTATEPVATEASESSSFDTAQRRSRQIEAELLTDASRYRMLTGDRPTGRLHIGHYFGSLANRVRLQDLGVDSWILIADYQVITDRDGVGPIRERVLSLLVDYLAVGLDPARSTIFTHSAVPALNQLLLPFLSLVTDSELRRNPTVKSELAASQRPMSGLMLTYPVHQAADILFCKANVVPVGKDQLPHLEQTRVVARRFGEAYGRRPGARVPAARRPAVRGAEHPRHRRGEDEQVARQHHRDRHDRRRDGQDHQARRHRLRPEHHLRPAGPSRGRQPAPARLAVHGPVAARAGPRRSATAAPAG